MSFTASARLGQQELLAAIAIVVTNICFATIYRPRWSPLQDLGIMVLFCASIHSRLALLASEHCHPVVIPLFHTRKWFESRLSKSRFHFFISGKFCDRMSQTWLRFIHSSLCRHAQTLTIHSFPSMHHDSRFRWVHSLFV
jgi:hypothetical protein